MLSTILSKPGNPSSCRNANSTETWLRSSSQRSTTSPLQLGASALADSRGAWVPMPGSALPARGVRVRRDGDNEWCGGGWVGQSRAGSRDRRCHGDGSTGMADCIQLQRLVGSGVYVRILRGFVDSDRAVVGVDREEWCARSRRRDLRLSLGNDDSYHANLRPAGSPRTPVWLGHRRQFGSLSLVGCCAELGARNLHPTKAETVH